ncbi:hypothetical protein K9N68_16960 [Kovacikia minuta CCNUW1]|uniref:hypothetical protein n=1 Tax=Kovacikia minuta TaxID=2931930 RepID=UPI001CCCB902|nr:hypothetical protein [Kovacikia minuta]UBF29372.1 hypothetical protein K9N68_16960 [Kovacikia minuta CCNUW1]
MVYVSQKQTHSSRVDDSDFTSLLDPSLIRSARQIYTTYYEVHPGLIQRPIGVAINRFTHRGKLIFSGKPVLLPQECFVPFSQIESELY